MMKKRNQQGSAKSATAPEVHDDATIRNLVALALDLTELDDYETLPDELKKKQAEFRKTIRKCLHQKKDAVLADALEAAWDEDGDAHALLKESIEEASEIIVFRRDEGPELEVNAFVIPLFARTVGGLHAEQCFQDEDAFELLRKSFQEGELESRQAKVALVSHVYHPDEIDRIGYSQLSAMIDEAFETMTRKKAPAAPALARSMSGWPESGFAPDDSAVELRFLLGFALKTLDDPFYRIPEKEAAADRYFEQRAERFRKWSQQVTPLVKRCLVTDGRDVEIDFLYQDLFHGGRETGIAEHAMLQMMSELQHGLQASGVAPGVAHAVLGPAEVGDGEVLRVNLYAGADGALIASSDKPIGTMRDLQAEADDIHDALTTLGVTSLALAMKFDADGQPVDVRPHELRQ
jgi:hypothetical protein